MTLPIIEDKEVIEWIKEVMESEELTNRLKILTIKLGIDLWEAKENYINNRNKERRLI